MKQRTVPECITTGQGQTALVLLHGIASGADSWQRLQPWLTDHYRLLAWNAPGYGRSPALQLARPRAADYAAALEQLLSHAQMTQCVMVGHSLGAIIAAAYAHHYPARLRGLFLADPAQGYARASSSQRDEIRQRRVQQLRQQGAAGYAEQRAPALLRPQPEAAALATVQHAMRQLRLEGFSQANHLLADSDLVADLAHWQGPLAMVCGEWDAITPLPAVTALAVQLGVVCTTIPDAGHASYIDNPAAFAAQLHTFMESLP